MEKSLFFLFILISIVAARELANWCPFLKDWAPTLSVERWKRRGLWGKKCVYFKSRNFLFVVNLVKMLFPIFILTWCVNKYFSRQGRSKNKRNNITIIKKNIFHFHYQLIVQIVTSYSLKNHFFRLSPKLI